MPEIQVPETPQELILDTMQDPKERRRYLGLWDQIKSEGLSSSLAIMPLDWAINTARKNSIWPMTFGLACCAIEMMAVGGPKFDMDRFGAGAFRATPRQADLMITAGTIVYKMAPRVQRLYEQMADPRFVMAMGACTVGGGPYYKYGYHVVKGADKIVPVDIYVPGCPPRPEALLDALFRLQEKMQRQHNLKVRYQTN